MLERVSGWLERAQRRRDERRARKEKEERERPPLPGSLDEFKSRYPPIEARLEQPRFDGEYQGVPRVGGLPLWNLRFLPDGRFLNDVTSETSNGTWKMQEGRVQMRWAHGARGFGPLDENALYLVYVGAPGEGKQFSFMQLVRFKPDADGARDGR
jgi:hypothetical protein